MYHTFQAATATSVSATEGAGGSRRRISTTNACGECRRRKIRCDGAQPCSQCSWYQLPTLCTYSKPTPRIVPSRKLVDRLQIQVDQLSSVVSRLFPGKDLESLSTLPREELINLALTPLAPASTSGTTDNSETGLEVSPKSDGAESLEALEQAPNHDPDNDETKRRGSRLQSITDDVNGLSLSVDRQSSYVGVSSITAALKVIFKTAPIARSFIAHSYTETALPSRSESPVPSDRDPDPQRLPPAEMGRMFVESYFAHVHLLMPMVDEEQFWHTYLYGQRDDSPWLALLNVVLALGALAYSTCDNEQHIVYFQRCRRHLDMETFGSGNLLVVQALGLLSGYYLHWLNRPNEANALMGATLRMASALGLHREYSEGRPSSHSHGTSISEGAEVPAAARRRTWWSLVCLDTWAAMTTGRPSLGRLGPGITVQSPEIAQHMNDAQYRASLKLLPLIHNIEFSKLATKIQDKLAGHPLIRPDELFSLDAELVKWHDELPLLMQSIDDDLRREVTSTNKSSHRRPGPSRTVSTASSKKSINFSQPPGRDDMPCPEVLKTPRAVMHWWYGTLRMLMHRPYLLTAALRRTSYMDMSVEEKMAISKCRSIAGQTIDDIIATCREELIAGWNAVWLIYQAVMVPLISLFLHLSTPITYSQADSAQYSGSNCVIGTAEDAEKWRQQIEMTIEFFENMQRFSVAARKSKDVVARLYDASKHVRQYHEAQYLQQQLQHSRQHHNISSLNFNNSTAPALDGFALSDQPARMPLAYTGGEAFDASTWNLNANGDAAMNNFWDDMMWDTLPTQDMNHPASFMLGMNDFDWNVPLPGAPTDMNGSDQNWAE